MVDMTEFRDVVDMTEFRGPMGLVSAPHLDDDESVLGQMPDGLTSFWQVWALQETCPRV